MINLPKNDRLVSISKFAIDDCNISVNALFLYIRLCFFAEKIPEFDIDFYVEEYNEKLQNVKKSIDELAKRGYIMQISDDTAMLYDEPNPEAIEANKNHDRLNISKIKHLTREK